MPAPSRNLLLLTIFLPATALAQSAHVYVGVGAQLPVSSGEASLRATRPALTVGWQLSPRWALELDPLLYWDHVQGTDSYVQNGDVHAYHIDNRYATLSLPLLARLTLSKPGRRWLVDGLGGVTWLRGWGTSTYRTTTNGQVDYADEYHYTSSIAVLTLGPQLRYVLSSRLSGKLCVPVNLSLVGGGSFSEHFYLTPQLGVQYAFAH